MKQFILATILVITGLAFAVSCNKTDNGSKQCTAAPPSAQAPQDGTANYYVTSTDDSAKLSSVIYQGTNGPVSLSNPALPFKISIFVKSGGTMSISAVGTGNGTLTAGYSFNNGTDSVSNYASCSK